MQMGNQHGGRKYDDLQNLLDMASHECPLCLSIPGKKRKKLQIKALTFHLDSKAQNIIPTKFGNILKL